MRRIIKIRLFGKTWRVKKDSFIDYMINYKMTKSEIFETIGAVIFLTSISGIILVMPYIIESIVK